MYRYTIFKFHHTAAKSKGCGSTVYGTRCNVPARNRPTGVVLLKILRRRQAERDVLHTVAFSHSEKNIFIQGQEGTKYIKWYGLSTASIYELYLLCSTYCVFERILQLLYAHSTDIGPTPGTDDSCKNSSVFSTLNGAVLFRVR